MVQPLHLSFGYFLFILFFPIKRYAFVTRVTFFNIFSYLSGNKELTMGIILRERLNNGGSTTFFLDIHYNADRKVEILRALTINKKKYPARYKENKRQAEAIRTAREHSFNQTGFVANNTARKTMVLSWMQAYVDKYDLKDKRNMQGVLNRFTDFLQEHDKDKLVFADINESLIQEFQAALKKRSTGEGARSYFSRFKKMMKKAYKANLMDRNYAAEVPPIEGKAAKKHTLTIEEIGLLAATPTEAQGVKQAFLFACRTGLRWVDVKALKWGSVRGSVLLLQQAKTNVELSIPLNPAAVALLGTPGAKDVPVFDLPTANGANKSIKAWVVRAGVEKDITFHCARHTAGTLMASMEVDLLTISAMLGHTTTKHTFRYVEASKELKLKAAEKLNF